MANEDPGDARYRENIRALRDAIAVNPFAWTRPLIEEIELERYGTTRDGAAGYRLVVFVRVDVDTRTCVLAWVKLERL